jgi:hypothetical protein
MSTRRSHDTNRITGTHTDELARSLPGITEVGAPLLVAAMGRPQRFRTAAWFKAFTGLTPQASETGETDRKGQAITKAGAARPRPSGGRPLSKSATNMRILAPSAPRRADLPRSGHPRSSPPARQAGTARPAVSAIPATTRRVACERGLSRRVATNQPTVPSSMPRPAGTSARVSTVWR